MSEPERESSDLIDFRKVKESTGFVFRSVRRHTRLAVAVLAFVVVGSATGLVVLPKSYRVEARLLVQLDPLFPSLAEPGRAQSGAEAPPLRAAVDTITARANLVDLIQRTDLLNEWSRHRAPALRLKDFLVLKLFGDVSEKDRLEGLVDLLRRRLVVWHDSSGRPNEGTVTISINWPDGQMAFRLVEAAQQGYIEARHIADMSAIGEANTILEAHASAWRAEAAAAADALRRAQGPKRAAGRVVERAVGKATGPTEPAPADPLSAELAAKQRAINDLEEARRRNLAELQRRLAEQRAIYTDSHPAVIKTQESIEALSQESPQLIALRKEAKDLEAGLMRRPSRATDRHPEPPAPVAVPQMELQRRDEIEDPEVESARARLKFALDKYQSLRGRIDSAALDLEARRAALKYRYTVVVPAEPPKGPAKPNVAVVGAAAVIAGLLLAAFAAVFADLHGGRIVETWQVERVLDLPVLAELTGP